MERRDFLRGLGAIACSAAAHPLMNTVTLASGRGLGDHRLIVVILRGGMDGLDVVQPLQDPDFRALRPGLPAAALPLTGGFALHEGLGGLAPLWQAGELAFVHATSTPYRDKRSHFDGQSLLEAGTGMDVQVGAARDGWLNRMVQAMPGLRAETAYAFGRESMPLLTGAGPTLSWTPEVRLDLSAQGRQLLEHVFHDDPLFREAGGQALRLSEEEVEMGAAAAPASGPLVPGQDRPWRDVDLLADFAATRLRGETRIAAFSLSGWDTHRGQAAALPRALSRLQRLVLRLRHQSGAQVWGRTVLMAMTEFGRTARENGSGGTDHGTAGAMLIAGGAVAGGRVLGRWPGLAEADLYDRRDLMPTSDLRHWAGWAMRGLYGLDRAVLERQVFPGLDLGSDPGLLL
ncbi:DUF1501 domain-containing protein [Szabonella alba]|uniref:DUF1501 domain-containing protein n=1 Tax=Szabonella alba TaxID=2804194 RepID=A0A8K0V4T8_9RHOB|nr:DUF1501 domain-containing protein [Szabonella alba]MBL4915834.1 DUF1501 domain-containing protein [Szabonella alba]